MQRVIQFLQHGLNLSLLITLSLVYLDFQKAENRVRANLM
ncbi:hypothetical protein [Klebsiella pneumoniae ISC21]|nr:hypothetical protein [Klebsiella pneumoniae ISC21]